jgi:hypothetical protein
MILPPGGFLTLGALLLGLAWWQERRSEHSQASQSEEAASAEAIAAVGIALSGSSSSKGEVR